MGELPEGAVGGVTGGTVEEVAAGVVGRVAKRAAEGVLLEGVVGAVLEGWLQGLWGALLNELLDGLLEAIQKGLLEGLLDRSPNLFRSAFLYSGVAKPLMPNTDCSESCKPMFRQLSMHSRQRAVQLSITAVTALLEANALPTKSFKLISHSGIWVNVEVGLQA